MPLFIKDSIIYRLFDKIIIKSYSNSLFKKFVYKILNCFKQSFLYKKVKNYLNKKPYFLNSLIYKFIRKIVKIIDKIMDFLYNIIKKCLLGSKAFLNLRDIKNDIKGKTLTVLWILIGSFNISYTIVSIFINRFNIYVSLGLLALAFVLFLFSESTNCFKQSFIYKIFKSW
ncbi:hypothetical protein [uncultured Tyzzerella sp.]|uniref:hypothetical protein n=1 Tax=uncultured Tyzzerella sp. TaxID=2321398 RepID=UPI0029424A7D|nr:hypothetical protein [uncultured Tyzzerella sp.]